MKERIIILSLLIICLVGCKKKEEIVEKKEDIISYTTNGDTSPYLYCETKDRYIYTHDNIDSIMFTYNNQTKELCEWLKEKRYFNDVLRYELSNVSTNIVTNPNDHVTKEYHVGDLVVVFCMYGNTNIIIGEDLDYVTAKCPETENIVKYDRKENDEIHGIYNINSYYGANALCIPLENREPFYEDENYKYYMEDCENLFVVYESMFDESLKEAFNNNTIKLNDLDLRNIKYQKVRK